MEFREYISSLDAKGELVRISEQVDWKFEIGKMVRTIRRPILFENIKEYQGYRLFANGMANKSYIAHALGLPSAISRYALVKNMRTRMAAAFEPILTDAQPVYSETLCEGEHVDLTTLPVPWWNELDGGRYIGTWHINCTKDPVTKKRNVGVYRMQIIGPSHTTVSVSPNSHLARHMQHAEAEGKSLEMAVAIGVNETVVMAAAMALPYETDEFTVAGALEETPINVVSCRNVDIELPSEAEIVLEGILENGVRVADGPYFDYAGIPDTNLNAYRFRVNMVRIRSDAIFRGTSVGIPGGEDHELFSILSRLGAVDFHGSVIRQRIQNYLLARRTFRLFQMTGRIGEIKRMVKGRGVSKGE